MRGSAVGATELIEYLNKARAKRVLYSDIQSKQSSCSPGVVPLA